MMRRKDREVTEPKEILEIMKRCDVCYLSLVGEDYPYVVPLNFGIKTDDGRLSLVFHCASQGQKLDLLRRNPNAAFAMSCDHILAGDSCRCTMYYASVCGRGKMRELEQDEKPAAMDAIMDKYRPGSVYEGPKELFGRTTMLALDVEEISGKAHLPK